MITLLGVTYKDYAPWEKGFHDNYDLIMKLKKAAPEKYKDEMDKLNQYFSEFSCPNPDCRAQHQMKVFGFYNRYVVTLKSVCFSVDEQIGEMLRLQCRSCLSTHALLPEDIIPYTAATVDTLALHVYAAIENPEKRFLLSKWPGKVKDDPVKPDRFIKMMAKSQAPQVSPLPQLSVPQGHVTSTAITATGDEPCSKFFDIRTSFKFFGPLLIGEGRLIPKIRMSRNFSQLSNRLSVSTLYDFREKLKEGWAYVTSAFRVSGMWDQAADPTLGEGIRILFAHCLKDIQKMMFKVHGMPFLFPVSCRRTGSSFPYTGCAY